MVKMPILIREQRYHQIKALLARLRMDAAARIVVLVEKDGQQIAVHGELGELDTTSLASLVAGNVAATGGMAKLIGEKEFPTLSHEGDKESIHISVIGRVLLVVVFDERSSLGLVKLRAKQVSQEIAAAFAEIERDSQLGPARRACRSARSPMKRSTVSFCKVNPTHHCSSHDFHQLRIEGNQLQDRLLRPRTLWQDHQPSAHLRLDCAAGEGKAHQPGDRDGPHAVF